MFLFLTHCAHTDRMVSRLGVDRTVVTRSWPFDAAQDRLGCWPCIGSDGQVRRPGLGLMRNPVHRFIPIILPLRNISQCKESLAGNGERTDNQNADHPDHKSYYNRNGLSHRCLADKCASRCIVIEDRDRDAPPGKAGIEACRENPCPEEIPDLSRFVATFFWRKDTCNPGEVHAAESERENGRPAHTCETQLAKNIAQCK